MTDIVDRLRFDEARCEVLYSKGIASNIKEAADAIERLTAENERLRSILDAALLYDAWAAKGDYPHDPEGCAAHDAIRDAVRSYQQQRDS